MRRILISTAAARRLEHARQCLGALAPGGALVLGVTRRAADDFARDLARERGHLLGVHTAQLGQLAQTLAEEILAERGRAPVSGLGRRALAARATFAVAQTRGLRYWAPIHQTPGFPKALARTIHELRQAGLGAEELAEASGVSPPDLIELLTAYERVLAESELTDEAGVYSAAAEAALRLQRPPLGLPLFILDLSPRTQLELQLLRTLVDRAPATIVCLHPEDTDGRAAFASILGPSSLETAVEENETGRLAQIRRGLFRLSAPAAVDQSGDDRFTLFSAASEAEECVEIARRILWAAEVGTPFDRMAVFLRDPELYGALVRDALRRAGVPAFFTAETKRPEPAGRALLALLECASEGFSATRFAEYLSLGQAPTPSSSGATNARRPVPWVAPRDLTQLVFETQVLEPEQTTETPKGVLETSAPLHWERLLVDASVVGERPRWSGRLRGLEEELQLQLRELDLESTRRGEIERRLEGLRRLQAFALPLIEFLASLPPKATWGAWLDFMGELATMALTTPELVLSTLAELRPMAKVGPVGLDEVKEVLRAELGFQRPATESSEGRFGKVFIGGIEEAAGRSFAMVFIPGLAEGAFPRKVEEDPLLLDDARTQIDPGLETREARTRRERLRLQLAVSAAEVELVASFPRLDRSEGRAKVPSFYALELIRAAEGALPDLKTLESRALAAAEARIGWPAPNQSKDAIDEVEHDLSVLAALIEQPRDQSRGRARYLLEANPHLGRSLRAQGRRWLPAWRSVDGLVDPDPTTLARLESQGLKQRAHSVSALESYSACPYRFLLQSIHQLRPRISPARPEALEPLTKSSIQREVQLQFATELAARPASTNHMDPAALLLELERVLRQVASRYEARLAPAIPRVWRRGVEALRQDLRGWLRSLTFSPEAPGLPAEWKIEFGADDMNPIEVLGGYRLRGTIDLIETTPTGGRWTVHLESGTAPAVPPRSIDGGTALRPVLEPLALEALRGPEIHGGRRFFATQRGGYRRIAVPLNEGTRKLAARALETIDHAIKTGFFPQAPRKGACDRCQYRLICGPNEELRASLKERGRLSALHRLRQMD